MKLIRLLSGLLVTALLLFSGCVPAAAPGASPEAAPAPTAEPAPIERECICISAFDGNKLTAAAGGFENGVFTPSGAAVELTVTEDTEFTGCSAGDLVKNAVLNAETQSGTALALELLYAPAPAITAAKNGSAAALVTEPAQLSGEYASENDDENALRIDGATASLSDATVTKSGGECTDPAAAAFGMNAALLAQNAATLAIVNSNIASFASDSAAAVAYCTGTTVNLTDSVITTSGADSPGLYASGAGSLTAANPDLVTDGDGSPALKCDSDGIFTVTGGSAVTHGSDSPAIVSASGGAASGAQLSADQSEAVRITDGGSVTLADCDVYGNMQLDGTQPANVRILSTGAESPFPSVFAMSGGTLFSGAGDMFYVENTACDILLSDVLTALSNDVLVRAAASDCNFSGVSQYLMGDFILDKASSLTLSLTDGCIFGGAVNPDNSGASVDFTLGADCLWLLTADSYLTSFTGDPASITANGYRVFVDGKPLADVK